MGYVLPINSYRSQQYANRLLDVTDSYAKVSKLRHIPKVGDYKEGFEHATKQSESKRKIQGKHDTLAASRSRTEVVGYVHPNPVNISIENGPVIQKGTVINAYI